MWRSSSGRRLSSSRRPGEVYPFIEAEKAQRRNVKRACALLKVSRAAFYAHRSGPSRREQEDAELAGRVREVRVRRPRGRQRRHAVSGPRRQCWDNALSESFFASLKGELIDLQA
jgi:transposase InsO family protein